MQFEVWAGNMYMGVLTTTYSKTFKAMLHCFYNLQGIATQPGTISKYKSLKLIRKS